MDTGAGSTRREALGHGVRIGLAGGAGVALGGAGAALVAADALGAATTGTGTGAGPGTAPPVPEPERVQRLLSVELLLLFCYRHVLAGSLLRPDAVHALAPLQAQEEAHVGALRARLHQLGATAPPPPGSIAQANRDLAHRTVSQRLGQLQGDKDALRLLLSVEKVAVGAYFVALTTIQDRSLITLVAEMMANDAQHEALIGELLYHGDATKAVPSGLVQGVQ